MSESIQQRLARLEDQAMRKIASDPAADTAATMKFLMANPLRFERACAVAEAAKAAHQKKQQINFDEVYNDLVKLSHDHLATLSPGEVAGYRRQLETEAAKTGNQWDVIAAEIACIQLQAFELLPPA